jgi:hypothetical protein
MSLNQKKLHRSINRIVNIDLEYKLYCLIMKKVNAQKTDLNIFSIALRKMCPDTRYSKTLSLEESSEILNTNILTGNIKITSKDVQAWFEQGVLRGEATVTGQDTKDREIKRYSIVQDDVENLALFLGIDPILECLGLRKKQKHPETGVDVIMQYTPTKQYRAGLTQGGVLLSTITMQLKNKKVLEFLTEALKEIDASS